jgi:Protein of unknown function (DUF3455)
MTPRATVLHTLPSTLTLLCAAALLSACAPMGARYSQAQLPATVQVPDGHQVALQTVGVGKIAYECKAKKDANGHEWAFVGPDAALNKRSGQQVGTYVGPPATWASLDGSKVTATQVAVAPAGAGNIPYQLVKAHPAIGSGAMVGVTYIQRVATSGGVAPSSSCSAETVGAKQWVPYQADYIFWKAV